MADLPGYCSFSYAFIWRPNHQFLQIASTEFDKIKSLYDLLGLIDNPGIINPWKYYSVIVNSEGFEQLFEVKIMTFCGFYIMTFDLAKKFKNILHILILHWILYNILRFRYRGCKGVGTTVLWWRAQLGVWTKILYTVFIILYSYDYFSIFLFYVSIFLKLLYF